MGPVIRMKVFALTGRNRYARGLRYILQLVNRLKNLSKPARQAANPKPILSAHHEVSSLLLNVIVFSPFFLGQSFFHTYRVR